MLAVTRKFQFDASHLLPGHPKQCKNLHGHTYILEVSVIDKMGLDGMVLDYGDLKAIVESVIKDYDHAFLCNKDSNDPAELEVYKWCKKYEKKFKFINGRTTTENIITQLAEELPFMKCHLKLYETPNSFVEVSKDGK